MPPLFGRFNGEREEPGEQARFAEQTTEPFPDHIGFGELVEYGLVVCGRVAGHGAPVAVSERGQSNRGTLQRTYSRFHDL